MRTVIALAFSVLFAVAGFAGNGGSAYTLFGIGDVRYFPSGRSAGMGFTGIGLPSSTTINTLVPAAWSRINKVRIEASGLYEGIKTAETDKTLFQAKGLFNGATLAFPISPANGVVFVGGFAPFSIVRYNISFNGSQQGVDYSINEIGSGGLTRANVGLSYAPMEDLSIGASVNYIFGNLAMSRAFTPTSAGSAGATLSEDESNRGVNFTLSGQYLGWGKISEWLRPVSLGFLVTTQANMKSEITDRLDFSTERDTLDVTQKRYSIPFAFGFGAGYQIAERWIIAADYYSQLWNDARYDGAAFANIRNSSRFGIGAEKLPIKDATKWLDKLAYRLGFSYNATQYKIYGEPINEWAVTGGFTMPVSGETRLNVGIEYTERGSKTTILGPRGNVNLVKDNVLRVTLSLSIVEPWFVRYEEE